MGFKIGFLKTVAFFKWIMVLDGVIETLYVTLWILVASYKNALCEARQEGYCLAPIMTPNQIKLPRLFLIWYTPAATVVVLFYFLNQSEPWHGNALYWLAKRWFVCSVLQVHYHSCWFVFYCIYLIGTTIINVSYICENILIWRFGAQETFINVLWKPLYIIFKRFCDE